MASLNRGASSLGNQIQKQNSDLPARQNPSALCAGEGTRMPGNESATSSPADGS